MILEHIRRRHKTSARDALHDVAAGLSDTGCEREKNEDRFVIVQSAAGTGFFVFDGMGGAEGGEAAAQLSVDAVRGVLSQTESDNGGQVLRNAIERAHQIISLRRQNQVFAAMGTTVVAAMIKDAEITIATVGDSRAYLIHDGSARQLTSDHTYVQDLVDQGYIEPQDALIHPQAHILTRCVGSTVGFKIDTKKLWIWPKTAEEQESDHLLLCSDGLYSLVNDSEIATIVASLAPSEACEKLIKLARERGGFDNITALIVPVGGVVRSDPLEQIASRKPKKHKKKKQPRVRAQSVGTAHISFGRHLLSIAALSFSASVMMAMIFFFLKLKGD